VASNEIKITQDEVLTQLINLKVNKSAGPDLIHPRVLFELRYQLAYPLTVLFNRSLETHQIPLIWKSANISAIYKKGKKNDPSNYRPNMHHMQNIRINY